MSKSTLSITVPTPAYPSSSHMATRTVMVPYWLPESFTFTFKAFGRTCRATAYLSGDLQVDEVELHDSANEAYVPAEERAEAILASIKTYLGMGPDVMPTTRGVLSAIAIAYEAEVAAYDAAVKAHAALPRFLHSLALLPTHPSESIVLSPAVRMLAKYVEHVVEQACKSQTERAEQSAKVLPFPSQVTP